MLTLLAGALRYPVLSAIWPVLPNLATSSSMKAMVASCPAVITGTAVRDLVTIGGGTDEEGVRRPRVLPGLERTLSLHDFASACGGAYLSRRGRESR